MNVSDNLFRAKALVQLTDHFNTKLQVALAFSKSEVDGKLDFTDPTHLAEFNISMDSLFESISRYHKATEELRASDLPPDDRVRRLWRAFRQHHTEVGEVAGLILSVARHTKSGEARDFVVDLYRLLSDAVLSNPDIKI